MLLATPGPKPWRSRPRVMGLRPTAPVRLRLTVCMWTLRRLRQSLRLRPVLQLQTLPLSLQTLQLPELPVLRQLHTLPPRLQSPAPAPLLPVTRSKMPQRLTISCGPSLDPGAACSCKFCSVFA